MLVVFHSSNSIIMGGNNLLYNLLIISACHVADIVAREAILHGEFAMPNDFRYQVSIMIAGEPNCGGGILKERFVLTVAHCVIQNNGRLIGRPVSVLAGTYDMSVAGTIIDAEKIFVLTEYESENASTTGDIAVLMLMHPFVIGNDGLSRLYLSRDLDHQEAKIAGFGMTFLPTVQRNDFKLRFANAYVRNHSQCQNDHPYLTISNKHLCARVAPFARADIPRGVCTGDGGGPLVANGHILIGVMSKHARDCDERTSSGIYTCISSYRNFIRNAMNDTETRYMRTLRL